MSLLNKSLMMTTVLVSSITFAQTTPPAASGARPSDNRATGTTNAAGGVDTSTPPPATGNAPVTETGTEASSNNGSTGSGRLGSKHPADAAGMQRADCAPDSQGRLNHSKHCTPEKAANAGPKKGRSAKFQADKGNQDSTSKKTGTNPASTQPSE